LIETTDISLTGSKFGNGVLTLTDWPRSVEH